MLKREWVRFGKAKELLGFCTWIEGAAPAVPGIVVIQEAWGVDPHIEDVALRFAKAGYVALAPDLFAENGMRPAALAHARMEALKEFINTLPPAAWGDPKLREEALAKLPEPRRSEVGESFTALFSVVMARVDAFVAPLVAAVEYLHAEHPLARGAKVGAVGYCLGGTLVPLLAAAAPDLGAAVIYYGSAPSPETIGRIACPVLGLYGALDTRVNAGIGAFAAAMQRHHKAFEHHIFEGAQHAFFNDTRPSYNAAASRDAFARTLEFFRRALPSDSSAHEARA